MIQSKTIILEKPYTLLYKSESIDSKNLKSNQLLCETYYTAISPGTETSAYKGQKPLSSNVKYPRLLGYCNVSKVLKTGKDVKSSYLDKFVLTFSSHRSHFIVDEKDVICVLPENICLKMASCTYLFHLGYNAILNTNICLGSSVAIIGLGTLGLTTANMAINAGANVFAVSNSSVGEKIGKKLGLFNIFNRKSYKNLFNKTGDRLCDFVISTTNSWSDWKIALEISGTRSTIGVLGFPGRDELISELNPLDSQYFYSKQLKIIALGASPENNDTRNFLKFNEKSNMVYLLNQIQIGKINPEIFVSDIIKPTRIEDAYKNIINRKQKATTYILEWKK